MELVSFVLVSAVVIAMPGPDTALVVRNALFGGRRLALATSLGVSCGLAIWSLAAAVGVAAVLRRSEPAFTALKLVGALYLAWLGFQALRLAWSGREPEPAPAPGTPGRREPRGSPGVAQQSLEPEDRRLLHELPAAVRTPRCELRRAARARPPLLPADARVALPATASPSRGPVTC